MRRRRRRSTRGAPTFGVSWRASRRSAGTEGMEAYLRRTVVWYGGGGLFTSQVFRSPALPPKYFRLVVQEIEVMGVRALGLAPTAAILPGQVFTIQSAVNIGRLGA